MKSKSSSISKVQAASALPSAAPPSGALPASSTRRQFLRRSSKASVAAVLALGGITIKLQAGGASSGSQYVTSISVTLTKTVRVRQGPTGTGPNGSYTESDLKNWIKSYDAGATVTCTKQAVPAGQQPYPGGNISLTPGGTAGVDFSGLYREFVAGGYSGTSINTVH